MNNLKKERAERVERFRTIIQDLVMEGYTLKKRIE